MTTSGSTSEPVSTGRFFAVDTRLFRQLGELLVGRDATALIELVKNAYDADATQIVIYGHDLRDGLGEIRLVDNGNGMTHAQLRAGFLTIAARGKTEGERRSPVFLRRYTGAKGVGRLAAHKLGSHLTVSSYAPSPAPAYTGTVEERVGQRNAASKVYTLAILDWDEIESFDTLDSVKSGVSLLSEKSQQRQTTGTSISISKLRRKWDTREIATVVRELSSFEPPSVLVEPLPRQVIPSPLLFDRPQVRDAGMASGFKVELEGDFSVGEEFYGVVARNAAWVIEMSADASQGFVRYAFQPTLVGGREIDEELRQPSIFHVDHPDIASGLSFTARVLVRQGNKLDAGQEARRWLDANSGLRVYLEGFRVLPYGEARDDWLRLDADYARRTRGVGATLQAEMLAGPGALDEVDRDAGLSGPPKRQIFGAVFLTDDGARSLRTLVNREGFVPDAYFDRLVDLVRGGLDLFTRVRARATVQQRAERRELRSGLAPGAEPTAGRDRGVSPDDTFMRGTEERGSLEQQFQEVTDALGRASAALATGDTAAASAAIAQVEAETRRAAEISVSIMSEVAMIRVLASVGTQLSAFVHDLNGLVVAATDAESLLTRGHQVGLPRVREAIAELRRSLEWQAAYLTDVVGPDSRRRRRRQKLREKFDSASRIVQHAASTRGVEIRNEIPAELQTPPMFPAELVTVFTNLLTNAVKAAGAGGRVSADGGLSDSAWVRLQNTGAHVALLDSEKWFQPFASTTSTVDPVLGQGMGLGLYITRETLSEYGFEVAFTQPEPGYATAVTVRF